MKRGSVRLIRAPRKSGIQALKSALPRALPLAGGVGGQSAADEKIRTKAPPRAQ